MFPIYCGDTQLQSVCSHHKPVLAVTSKRGRSLLSGKNPSSRLGWKNHLLSEDTKLKFLLCACLLVFSVHQKMFLSMTTVIFRNFPLKVLKIYHHSFFFNSENLLSSIEQCMVPAFILPVREVSLILRHLQQDGGR